MSNQRFSLPALLLATALVQAHAQPVISPTGPDAEAYGQSLNYPSGHPFKRQQYLVGNFSHYDAIAPVGWVKAAAHPSELTAAATPLAVTYFYQGQTRSFEDYLAHNQTTGLLIAKDDTILFEHYQYARTEHDRMTSQSMAKTITSLLIGIALQDGAIHSIDDLAQTYVPELTNTEFGKTPIRALLHMAAGIAFQQDYSDTADDAKFRRLVFQRNGPGPIAAVAAFNTRVAPPGTVWNYANIDTEVLGLILTRATHQTLANLLQTQIWQPMGAEADATWGIDPSGQGTAFCCFNATVRDYARLALLLAHDGARDGQQIIPRQYLLDATEPVTVGSFRAVTPGARRWGYGYQVWLMPGPRRTFVLEGINGQRIYVDPATHLVLVHTAVRAKATHNDGDIELTVLWNAVLAKTKAQ